MLIQFELPFQDRAPCPLTSASSNRVMRPDAQEDSDRALRTLAEELSLTKHGAPCSPLRRRRYATTLHRDWAIAEGSSGLKSIDEIQDHNPHATQMSSYCEPGLDAADTM